MKPVLKAVGSRVSWVVINALTGIVTAHALGPKGRGDLAAMIMWPVFLAGVLTLGIPSSLVFSLPMSSLKQRSQLVSMATVIGLAIGLVASLAGFVLLPHWLSMYDSHVVRSARYLMFFTTVSMLMLIFRAAFEAIGDFGKSAGSWILTPVQTLLALLLLLYFNRLSEFTAALSYVLAGIPVLIWLWLRLIRSLGFSLTDWRGSSYTLLSYGIRSYGIDLCGTLSQSIDQALVVGLISAAAMGQYVVCLSLSRTINSVYQASAVVLFPRCVGLSRRSAFQLAIQYTSLSTLAIMIPSALIFLFGSALLRVLYGSEYTVAILLLRLLVGESIISGIITLLSQPFMALGRPGTVTILQSFGLISAVPLLLLLVPRYGTVGAGISLLLSALLRLLLVVFSYVQLAERKPRLGDFQEIAQDLVLARVRRLVLGDKK